MQARGKTFHARARERNRPISVSIPFPFYFAAPDLLHPQVAPACTQARQRVILASSQLATTKKNHHGGLALKIQVLLSVAVELVFGEFLPS